MGLRCAVGWRDTGGGIRETWGPGGGRWRWIAHTIISIVIGEDRDLFDERSKNRNNSLEKPTRDYNILFLIRNQTAKVKYNNRSWFAYIFVSMVQKRKKIIDYSSFNKNLFNPIPWIVRNSSQSVHDVYQIHFVCAIYFYILFRVLGNHASKNGNYNFHLGV